MVNVVYEVEVGGKVYTISLTNGGPTGYIFEEAEEKNEPVAYIVPLSSNRLEIVIDLTTTEFGLTKETEKKLRKLVRELQQKAISHSDDPTLEKKLWSSISGDGVYFAITDDFVDEAVVKVAKIALDPKNWRKVTVLECPVCGRRVRDTETDLIGIFPDDESIQILFCPEFDQRFRGQHVVAFKWRGKWKQPSYFYHNPKRDGLVEVKKGSYDNVTLYLLYLEAIAGDDVNFKRPNLEWMKAKILWKNGEPVGYYAYSVGVHEYPALHQIFVRKKFRRQGYARLMLEDFLGSFEGIILIEEPNEATQNLLVKLGLARHIKGGIESTGRVRFFHSLI